MFKHISFISTIALLAVVSLFLSTTQSNAANLYLSGGGGGGGAYGGGDAYGGVGGSGAGGYIGNDEITGITGGDGSGSAGSGVGGVGGGIGGGVGGAAFNDNTIGFITIDTLTAGGDGDGGGGGGGGTVKASFGASQTIGTVSIIGGGGGVSVSSVGGVGVGGAGGVGGGVSLITNGHTLDVTDLILQSRVNGVADSDIDGGRGGAAFLDASGGDINIGSSLTMENLSSNSTSLTNVNLLKFTGSAATVDLKQTSGTLSLNAQTTDFSDATTATINASKTSLNDVKFGRTWLAKTTDINLTNNASIAMSSVVVKSKSSVINYTEDGSAASWSLPSNIDFLLPSNIANSDIMLTVHNGVDLNSSTVGILSGNYSLSNLQLDDQIKLITGALTGAIANDGSQITATYGATMYGFDISSDSSAVYADLKKRQEGALSKAYLEPASGNLAQQNMAYDSVLGQLNNLATTSGTHSFGAVEGYGMRINSGSHVDATGTNISVGGYVKDALLTYGAFLETGLGSYDSHNSFASVGKVKGSGDTNYYGAGAFGKYYLPKDFYVDASARLGWVDSDYKSKTLSADYESDSLYYGTHIGAGHNLKVDCSKTITSYAQLIMTRQEGDTVKPVATERLKIDDSISVRTRLGLRYTQDIKSNFKAYTGAAWDYEHDGKQKGKLSTSGVISSVDSPDIKGSTGMFELGGSWNIKKTAWTIDTAIRGYVGKREGVSGSLQAGYKF